ncbi:MAG: hypothetical protein NVV70_04985 [Cellulomonas sp.]|nr:hypothetical protein [Cellulomonas sp.]MCR6647513.1 hypothetical protein [Cellulomonas sp.]
MLEVVLAPLACNDRLVWPSSPPIGRLAETLADVVKVTAAVTVALTAIVFVRDPAFEV